MKITGCYREKLTKELWDRMTPQIRFNHLSSLWCSDKKKKEWSELPWDRLGSRKNLVKGEFAGYILARYATSKFGSYTTGIERRTKICPNSTYYRVLESEMRVREWKKNES